MPYARNADLPKAVANNLPRGAQTIFRKAFNSAYEHYADPKKRRGRASRDTTARKVAWNAVKKEYKKNKDGWTKK